MAVEFVANYLMETLRDLLFVETKFLFNASGEMEKVESDLRSIHGLLMEAYRKRCYSPTLNKCAIQLSDLAFKAENVLETYALEVGSEKEGRWDWKEKVKRYELGKEAGDIISRLTDLRNKVESELGQQSSSHEDELLRQTYAHEVEHHFVGMEKDIELLVSMVKDETRRRRFIKIYGMGGLGKTTLARKIYNHREVASYARAWVCITQQFDAKAVLTTILKELGDDGAANTDSMGVTELVKRVHSFLEHRKSLTVIDDIWENDHWEVIKAAFPMNCSVLLTTRSQNIGNHHECHSYELGFLTEDQGWDLLQKIAALPQDSPVESLEKIGREIVVKCGHLPLSISVIGGILHQEDTFAQWKKVNMKMVSYLKHGGEGVAENKRVRQVLDLSFDSLPYYLKPCFLHLASFPEHEEIDTERLYLLWIAESFISHQDNGRNESLRDVAERYLIELATRCMVQLHKGSSPLNKFDSCRLHDLMHKLCSSKVEHENFLQRIDLFSSGLDDIPMAISTSTKGLARSSSIGNNSSSRVAITIDSLADKLSIEGLEKVEDLRSLMLFRKSGYRHHGIEFEDSTISLDKSPYLRILMLDGCGKLPSKVGKLVHMRYFSLRDTKVRDLPEFVCALPNLHTLDLRREFSSLDNLRLPNEIWKMKRLRHLFLPRKIEVIGGEKLRLDGLVELETLDYIDGNSALVADIPKLKSLRKLGVRMRDVNSMSVVALHTSNNNSRLCETHFSIVKIDLSPKIGRAALKNVLMSPSLVTLDFENCNVGDGFRYYQQEMCQNLVKLSLKFCQVGGDVMEVLGKYPMLQTLLLHTVEFKMTEILIFPSNSFPQLKSLEMYFLNNLRELQVEESAMPKLTEYVIHRCNHLKEFPDRLRLFMSNLGYDSASTTHMPSTRFDVTDNVDATNKDNDAEESEDQERCEERERAATTKTKRVREELTTDHVDPSLSVDMEETKKKKTKKKRARTEKK